MDPTLFRIDFSVLTEVLITIIVLAFLVERALSIVFEHRLYVRKLDKTGWKEVIAFLVSFWVVWYWQFDALSIILHADRTSVPGNAITAAVIAGGSKASIKLFHDLMNVKSSAVQERAQELATAKGESQ